MLASGLGEFDLRACLEQLREQGHAPLGRVLSDSGLEALRGRAEDLMLGRVSYPGLFFQLDGTTGRSEDAPRGLGWQGPSLCYRKLEKLERDPLFLAWLANPLFERIARGVIGDGQVVLYRAILFNKAAQAGSVIPWHQDGGKLWGLSREPDLQIWTALDDAPEGGGCLEVLPGSHVRGLATELGGVVPVEQVLAARADERARPLPVTAGEAVLLDNRVWHRSGLNRRGQRRLAFSACYMDGATRCLRQRRPPRIFFEVFPSRSGGV